MKTKFRNKNGTLTEYSFICGYTEYKGDPYSENYLMLYREHNIYHVKGCIQGNDVWWAFESLTKARKQYRTIKIKNNEN